MPKGSSILISGQAACLRFTPPSTTEAVKSSASTSGTANCSGWESASSGTEISAEPKPVMPRMKYALIRMHRIKTMSATAGVPLNQEDGEDAIVAPHPRAGGTVNLVLQTALGALERVE